VDTPNSGNLMVGSGEVWFNRLDNSGDPTGYRHLGNVSKLEITPEVTEITKKSSMNSARAVRGRAITETKMNIALTFDEFEPENVALALLGEKIAIQAADGAIADEPVPEPAKQGRWLDTGFVNITVTAVKVGATTHAVDDDYTLDLAAGLIYIVPGGDIADDDAVTWSGSCAASGAKVQGLSQGRIEGALLYRSSDDQIGPKSKIVMHKVSISPDGALALIGDQFFEGGLKGEVLADETQATGQEYMVQTFLDADDE
jgi:hypothetical protein